MTTTIYISPDAYYAIWKEQHQIQIRRIQKFLHGEDENQEVFNDVALKTYNNFPEVVDHNLN